ncbi:hypothetical protein [Thermocrinis sp.]
MDSLLAWVLFIVKVLIALIVIGVPFFLVVVFISNFLYKKIDPKYEEIRKKRMKELGGEDGE